MFNLILNKVQSQPVTTITVPFRATNIGDLVGMAINIIIGVGWALAFVYLALGFIQYITSKGEKEKTKDAQSMLTYAILGAIGLLLIGSLITIIPNMLGVRLPEGYVPSTQNSGGGGGGGNLPGGSSCSNGIDCASGVCRSGRCTL